MIAIRCTAALSCRLPDRVSRTRLAVLFDQTRDRCDPGAAGERGLGLEPGHSGGLVVGELGHQPRDAAFVIDANGPVTVFRHMRCADAALEAVELPASEQTLAFDEHGVRYRLEQDRGRRRLVPTGTIDPQGLTSAPCAWRTARSTSPAIHTPTPPHDA